MTEEIEPMAELAIYVAPHCENCAFARTVAARIARDYPHVRLRVVDLAQTEEPIPDEIFATPTYLLNGRVWSLGNPSDDQIEEALGALVRP